MGDLNQKQLGQHAVFSLSLLPPSSHLSSAYACGGRLLFFPFPPTPFLVLQGVCVREEGYHILSQVLEIVPPTAAANGGGDGNGTMGLAPACRSWSGRQFAIICYLAK